MGKSQTGRVEIWERKMMRLTDLPHCASQAVTWANELALGNKKGTKICLVGESG